MADRADELARELVGKWLNANNSYLGGTGGPAAADLAQRIATALREKRRVQAEQERDAWRTAAMEAMPALAAAISLLERTPKAKKAAWSDKVFNQMLVDYRNHLESARAAIRTLEVGRGD